MEMKIGKENWALGLVLLATLLTGMLGVFKSFLNGTGMNNYEITFIKFTMATIVIGIGLAFLDRDSLKLKRWQDIGFLTGIAIVNIGFTVCIFFAMDTNLGIGLSSALQSTNVYFILILAAIFFGEKITTRKVLAVCIGFVGCLFVVNIFTGDLTMDPLGIVLSLISALGVAVFWLGGKYAGQKGYSPGSTLFFVFLISSVILVLFPSTDVGKVVDIAIHTDMAWFYIIGAGIISTMIPKYMITQSIQMADAGKVSVCLAFDMVTSAICGAVFLGESISFVSAIGIFMIIFSISLIELKYFDRFFKDKSHGEEPA